MRLVLASLSYVQITPPKPFLIVIRLYSVHKKLIFHFDKCLVLWFAAGKPSFGGSKLSFGGSKPLFGRAKRKVILPRTTAMRHSKIAVS